MQGQELDSVICLDPFQHSMFCDPDNSVASESYGHPNATLMSSRRRQQLNILESIILI